MEYYYYCPICGCVFLHPGLCHNLEAIKSLHEREYYSHKALIRYGNELRWEDVLMNEEIYGNPLYQKESEYKNSVHITSQRKTVTVPVQPKAEPVINKPKCPTCNSTNIKKISTSSKVIGAAFFGLFSKTAKSQFVCNNCGYKW